jgi:3-hydroxyisobutyrate dehydrogenase-like beta-hydroxyacid dehydrogenase
MDAPVSGGPRAVFERCRPVLDAMADNARCIADIEDVLKRT